MQPVQGQSPALDKAFGRWKVGNEGSSECGILQARANQGNVRAAPKLQAHYQFRRQHSDLVRNVSSNAPVRKLIPFYRYSSIRHTHITEEIKKTISTKQTEIEGAITTADRQLIVLESRLEELNLSSDDQEATGSTESNAEALQQLEEEREALNASRKVLDELLSKSKEEAVAKAAAENQSHSTTATFGNQNSGFQAGSIYGSVSKISFGGK